MTRIYTARIVTSMTDKHFFWNSSIMHFIRNSMSSKIFSVYGYSTIAILVSMGNPLPTRMLRNHFHIAPKSFFNSFHTTSIPHSTSGVK
jgi:hypothetical protein